MTVVGKHIYANCRSDDPSVLSNESFIRAVVEKAVEEAGATLVSIQSFFADGPHSGVSVVAIVNESHISVHTWDKENFVTVDAYTCGEHTEPMRALEYIRRVLGLRECEVTYVVRSSR